MTTSRCSDTTRRAVTDSSTSSVVGSPAWRDTSPLSQSLWSRSAAASASQHSGLAPSRAVVPFRVTVTLTRWRPSSPSRSFVVSPAK
ncbi:hypothetical protein LC1Hm_1687 [Halomicrobium sp. LC1Hm]|nr:hypothetical protein LC1Hm_1687 [Halomicrobium sp. LC1Hm]